MELRGKRKLTVTRSEDGYAVSWVYQDGVRVQFARVYTPRGFLTLTDRLTEAGVEYEMTPEAAGLLSQAFQA